MNLQESFMDFPAPVFGDQPTDSCHPARLRSKERKTLKAMSLVHRAWTGPARRALRRRSDVHSPEELLRFLRSRFCGKWVQEFAYSMPVSAVSAVVSNAPGNPREVLSRVFEHLSNLKALSFALENGISNVGAFRLAPIFLPAPRSLQVLHIYLHQWTADSLCELRGVISVLRRLHTLSIMGESFTADADESQFLYVAESAVPPASLKRLHLRFCVLEKDAIPYLAWLFTPREGYALHELRIRHNRKCGSGGVRDAIDALLPILSPVLAELKVLELLLSKVRNNGSCTLVYFPESFQALMDQCTSLEKLHTQLIGHLVPKLELPRSLQTLQVFE